MSGRALDSHADARDGWGGAIDCAGVGQCHGCVKWCGECGDVGAVCSDATKQCMAHHCWRCGIGPAYLDDGYCEECREQEVRDELRQRVERRNGREWTAAIEAMLLGIRRELDAWAERPTEHRCYSRFGSVLESVACSCGSMPTYTHAHWVFHGSDAPFMRLFKLHGGYNSLTGLFENGGRYRARPGTTVERRP